MPTSTFSFKFDVGLTDGTRIDVVASAPDLIRLEKRFNVAFSSLMPSPLLNPATGAPVLTDAGDVVQDPRTSGLRLEHFAFLAWSALRRRRDDRVNSDFDAFVDQQLESVEMIDDDQAEAGDPEAPAGSAG